MCILNIKKKTKIRSVFTRERKNIENSSYCDDERSTTLEKQLVEAQIIAEEADRRYDEVSKLSQA